jgi:hypothetical protein
LKRENESLKLQLGQQAWQATEYSSQDHEDLSKPTMTNAALEQFLNC